MVVVAFVGSTSFAQAQQAIVKSETVDNTRHMRFCEILVVRLKGIDVYNTTGVSECPARLWNALNTRHLRRQLHALRVEKNGPHFWMMDSQTALVGKQVSFGGVEARWVATLPLRSVATLPLKRAVEAATGSIPYNIFTPKKTQRMVYSKGKPVYELVDPDGNIYVLQAHKEQFSIASLDKLGERLKLPNGWQFRTRELAEDLIVDLKSDQTIYAVADDFHQNWTRIPKSD
jgi:hypothetical protein